MKKQCLLWTLLFFHLHSAYAGPGEQLREESLGELLRQLRPSQTAVLNVLVFHLRTAVYQYVEAVTSLESILRDSREGRLTSEEREQTAQKIYELEAQLRSIHRTIHGHSLLELALPAFQKFITEDFKDDVKAQRHVLLLSQLVFSHQHQLHDNAHQIIKTYIKFLESLALKENSDTLLSYEAARTLHELLSAYLERSAVLKREVVLKSETLALLNKLQQMESHLRLEDHRPEEVTESRVRIVREVVNNHMNILVRKLGNVRSVR